MMHDSKVRGAVLGAIAGAVGTIAMDALLYMRARKAGGEGRGSRRGSSPTASRTGTRHPRPARSAARSKRWSVVKIHPTSGPVRRPTSSTGSPAGWGAQYGFLAGTSRRRVFAFGLLLGPAAWLSSYVVLPLAKVYKPIWEYDKKVLADDLSAHMVYGARQPPRSRHSPGASLPRTDLSLVEQCMLKVPTPKLRHSLHEAR